MNVVLDDGGTSYPSYQGMYYTGYYNSNVRLGSRLYREGLVLCSCGDDINTRITVIKAGSKIGSNINVTVSGEWKIINFEPNQSIYAASWVSTPGFYKIKSDGLLTYDRRDALLEVIAPTYDGLIMNPANPYFIIQNIYLPDGSVYRPCSHWRN